MKKFKQVILEFGMARLRHHLAQGHHIGIISSATPEDASKERHHKMVARLRQLGYGATSTTGKTKEWGSETSAVVPNISLQHLKNVGDEFGQQAVIHTKGDRATLHYLKAAGEKAGKHEPIGHAHYNKKNDNITALKGRGWRPKDNRAPERSFTFESSGSTLSAMGKRKPLWKKILRSLIGK